jgi:geranylgeranyl diphosphate synthase type I
MEIIKEFVGDRKKVFDEIQNSLNGEPDKLYEAAKHLCLAGGKMVRPMMCMMACEAVGGIRLDAVRSAAAIEMTHTFTLVHDDIMDNDLMRRGTPSVHAKYGIPTAILAGDLLFSKAYEICDAETVHILAKATCEICEGQEMDMSFEDRMDVSEAEYLEMIKKKTAVLLQAAMESGATIGKGSAKQIKALGRFGLNLGMAFQIQDDILGMTANEGKLGKKVGNDIIEGKKNIIIIKGMQMLKGKERDEFIKILSAKNKTNKEVENAITLLKNCGAIDYCRKKAENYVTQTMDSLSEITNKKAKQNLMDIANYIVKRDY